MFPAPLDELNNRFSKFYKIVPCSNLNVFLISWLFSPSVWEENLKSWPMELIGYIFNHRGEGSIVAYLRSQNFVTSIVGGTVRESVFQNQFYTFFTVMAEVTPTGLEYVTFMVDIIFTYLAWMKDLSSEVLEVKFMELVKCKEKEFHYSPEAKVSDKAQLIAEVLHMRKENLERERVILDTHLLTEFNQDATRYVLHGFTPTSANFILGSQKFKHPKNLKEEYHEVRYNSIDIPDAVMHDWMNPDRDLMKHFKIPTKNQFIVQDLFCVKGCGRERTDYYSEKNKMAVFYSNDPIVSGLLPYAKYKFTFCSGRMSTDRATATALSMIWLWILDTELHYQMADTADAGFQFQWSWEKSNKLIASVERPSQCIFQVVTAIFDIFKKSDTIIKGSMFESFRDLCHCTYENMQMENPKYAHDVKKK